MNAGGLAQRREVVEFRHSRCTAMPPSKASVLKTLSSAVAGLALSGVTLPSGAVPECSAWNTREFFQAATAADVSRCINAGADVASKTVVGFDYNIITPLNLAARYGTPEVVKALISAGANVNGNPSYYGRRSARPLAPLHSAALGQNLEVVKVLIAAGANVNAKADHDTLIESYTPLHFAASNENPEVVKVLIAAGANVNAKLDGPARGRTPLHSAASTRNPEVVKVLIAAGANINAEIGNSLYFSSPHAPSKRGRGNDSGLTPLHRAASSKNLEVVKVLVAAGANVNAKGLICLFQPCLGNTGKPQIVPSERS